MIVGRSAPRYETMALLYPRSKILQSHLSEYFIVVVRLCHQLLKFTKKSILGQLVSFLSDSDMKNYQSELDQWASSIREEVSMLMGLTISEQNSHLKALLGFSESELHRQRLQTHTRVLDSCSTYDYQKTWKEIRKAGNATFFNQTPEYQGWNVRADSCTLVCKGKLGSGKSVLLANIIDDLNLHIQSTERLVAYFFCRHDISESLEARIVLGSLARQLLRPISDLTIVEELVDKTDILDCDGILSMIHRVLPPDFKASFVLDGLDECDDLQRRTLIQHLRTLQDAFSLHICVSFRLEADDILRLSPELFANYSVIAIPDDNPDIASFISAELERRIGSREPRMRLTIGNPELILDIEDALLQGAHGMFLWVALQIESLCTAKTDEDIRLALKDLPKDLPETFSRIMQKSGELGKHYQTRVFELVAVAHRPLTTDELREALSVVPGDAVWRPTRVLHDIYSALACCGSLIAVDEEDSTVRLVHHSVKQFLLGSFRNSTSAIFTVDRANRTMREVIFTYLNYDVFNTQLSRMVVPEISTEATPSVIVRSIDTLSSVQSLALKLLQSRRQPNYNIGRVLSDARKRFKSPSVDQFQFYSYAKQYWLQHGWCTLEHEPIIHRLILKFLGGGIVDVNTRDNKIQSLLFRAAENGADEILRLLIKKGADLETKDTIYGQTLLAWAAEKGHEATVKLLLQEGANIESKNLYDRTPIWHAAENGHEAVAELLLQWGANINSKDSRGETPLSHAAENGHGAVIKLLLKKGANIESKNLYNWTPLLHAIVNRHEAVIKLLLEKNANIESKDYIGQTPLSHAAKNGHKAIVELLLKEGANINSKDSVSRTPLWYAAMNGHEATVKLLLEKGANIKLRSGDGRTPLLCATENGHMAIVKLLQSYKG